MYTSIEQIKVPSLNKLIHSTFFQSQKTYNVPIKLLTTKILMNSITK